MNIDAAPKVEDDDIECGLCGEEGTFVLFDGDKVCLNCAHIRGDVVKDRAPTDPWHQWWQERKENYSELYGDDRAKMIGGFTHPYP